MRRWQAAAVALAAALPLGAASQDAALGRVKAQACALCHGPQGLSQLPDAPHLAGQPALYLGAQLRAFRSGARRHEVMAVIAKGLSDDEIEQLAAWYASLKISVQPAP